MYRTSISKNKLIRRANIFNHCRFCNDYSIKFLFNTIKTRNGLLSFCKTKFSLKDELIIKSAQELLGFLLPKSYIWFLKNFSYGILNGKPLYTLFPLLLYKQQTCIFDYDINYSDLIYQNLYGKVDDVPDDCVVFFRDIDYTPFFFNKKLYRLGEYKVFFSKNNHQFSYARNFYEFLNNKIKSLTLW